MSDQFHLGAYWASRREPAEACARRLAHCLRALASAHEALSSWYKTGKVRTGEPPIPSEPSELKHHLLAGRNRKDFGGAVIEELGFRVNWWNRQRQAAVGLHLGCGMYPAVPGLLNSFVLNFPSTADGAMAKSLHDVDVVLAVMRAAVEAWDPDWATFANDTVREAQAAPGSSPWVGWLTYLHGNRPIPAQLPQWATQSTLHDGTIIQLAGTPLELSFQRILQLRAELMQGGALVPTTTPA